MIVLNPKDGKKAGFLWKPVSDSKGKPCTLTPLKGPDKQKWSKPFKFERVELFKDGKRITALKFRKHFDEGTVKEKNRQIWDCPIVAEKLPKNIQVVATDKKGIQFAWPIKDPTKRVD